MRNVDVLIARHTEKHPRRPEEQFKCLCIAMKAPQYAACKQIHENLRLQFFTNHISSLAVSFKLEVLRCGEFVISAI